MSQQYIKAKQEDMHKQLHEHYNSVREQQTLYDKPKPFKYRDYSMLQHYVPYGLGLGSVVAIGLVALGVLNRGVRQEFESVYFSSY